MKIESVSQKADRAGQYYLKLSDGCVLRLYPQTVAEFHLYAGRELEAEELEKLRAALCRLHHKKEIVFDVRTDPALLGGFTLDIEGVRYDKSVRGALGRMGRQLEERRMA